MKMKKIALTDGSGRWFNQKTAQEFKNDFEILKDESLYLTVSGKWILKTDHTLDFKPNTIIEISQIEADNWFKQNHIEKTFKQPLIFDKKLKI